MVQEVRRDGARSEKRWCKKWEEMVQEEMVQEVRGIETTIGRKKEKKMEEEKWKKIKYKSYYVFAF